MPAVTPLLASVAVPVTLAEPLKLPLVYVTSPVIAIVRPVVRVAALPLIEMPQVPEAPVPVSDGL